MEAKTLILILGAIGGAAFLTWFFLRLKKNQDELQALIEQRFAHQTILKRDRLALLVAQESRGLSQRRGNGNLILTADELFFSMTMPKTVFMIPLSKITEIDKTYRMGGKCIMKDMLKISYIDEAGQADALAIHVEGLADWQEAIRSAKLRS